MKQFIDSAADHITSISIICGGVIAVLSLRKKIVKSFIVIYRWSVSPATCQAALNDFRAEFTEIEKRKNERDKNRDKMQSEIVAQLERVTLAIFNGGSNGMMHSIDMIKAMTKNTFETESVPMFVSDHDGEFVSVNRAYRDLVLIYRDDDVAEKQWQVALSGPLKHNYIRSFEYHAERGEDFIGDCDFICPLTNEQRGRWKVQAKSSRRTDGGFIYVGRFIGALDETARSIAQSNKWSIPFISS